MKFEKIFVIHTYLYEEHHFQIPIIPVFNLYTKLYSKIIKFIQIFSVLTKEIIHRSYLTFNSRYVVGSLSMNSPAPSPSESTTDLPEIIASHDNIIKTKIISGVTNDEGETKFYVSGVTKEIEHVPKKIISNSTLLKPIKNVPPCGCAIEKAINEGLSAVASDDNIPCSKNEQMCIGKKYRPQEGGGIDCKEYPNDKSCRRNPFKKKLDEKIMAAERAKKNSGKKKYPPEEKNMYSLAEFQPCGDGDGMAVCGGPWGAVNVPDEEELARRAAEEKLILQVR